MAAISEYPTQGSAIVRGDPLAIPVHVSVNGEAMDASEYDWRSQIRTSFDGTLVTEFAIETVTADDDTVPSTVLLTLTADQTALLESGYVFDVEQLDRDSGETIRTWWIVKRIFVQKDVSRDE